MKKRKILLTLSLLTLSSMLLLFGLAGCFESPVIQEIRIDTLPADNSTTPNKYYFSEGTFKFEFYVNTTARVTVKWKRKTLTGWDVKVLPGWNNVKVTRGWKYPKVTNDDNSSFDRRNRDGVVDIEVIGVRVSGDKNYESKTTLHKSVNKGVIAVLSKWEEESFVEHPERFDTFFITYGTKRLFTWSGWLDEPTDARFKIPPELLRAIAKQESHFDPWTENDKSGALGLMQIVPWKDYGLIDNKDNDEYDDYEDGSDTELSVYNPKYCVALARQILNEKPDTIRYGPEKNLPPYIKEIFNAMSPINKWKTVVSAYNGSWTYVVLAMAWLHHMKDHESSKDADGYIYDLNVYDEKTKEGIITLSPTDWESIRVLYIAEAGNKGHLTLSMAENMLKLDPEICEWPTEEEAEENVDYISKVLGGRPYDEAKDHVDDLIGGCRMMWFEMEDIDKNDFPYIWDYGLHPDDIGWKE